MFNLTFPLPRGPGGTGVLVVLVALGKLAMPDNFYLLSSLGYIHTVLRTRPQEASSHLKGLTRAASVSRKVYIPRPLNYHHPPTAPINSL